MPVHMMFGMNTQLIGTLKFARSTVERAAPAAAATQVFSRPVKEFRANFALSHPEVPTVGTISATGPTVGHRAS
jgi:hypothetical protein